MTPHQPALRKLSGSFILMTLFSFCYLNSQAQLSLRDFALYGGDMVQLSTSTSLSGGAIGSKKLVKTNGNFLFNGNIFSDGTIELANNNTIQGNIVAANQNGLSGNTIKVGSNAAITGNIVSKGSVDIGGGVVTGSVTYSGDYNGPTPGGGKILNNNPFLQGLPTLPVQTVFHQGQ